MKVTFENEPKLGIGIYTIPDIAYLLNLPYPKVNRWINEYWDRRLGAEFNNRYTWTDGKAKAVSFHTLIELYTFFQFSNAGVKTPIILESHQLLAKKFETAFPFATSYVLKNVFTDGKRVYFKVNDEVIYTLDSTHQLNLQFIRVFFKKLDFDNEELASRFWPSGKTKSIVIDPKYRFGQPIIEGTNIIPSTIYGLFKSGEPSDFIASLYNLSEKQVTDAINYCKLVA